MICQSRSQKEIHGIYTQRELEHKVVTTPAVKGKRRGTDRREAALEDQSEGEEEGEAKEGR